jgi:uncharacterized membrane protein
MPTVRLEAFTDGVLAIVITIMVLELGVPKGDTLADLASVLPLLVAYVLSFLNVGIYWSNHHHLLQAADRIDGRVLWSNLALLFFLSLLPFTIRWLDSAGFAAGPAAAYGVILTLASAAWIATRHFIIDLEAAGSPMRELLLADRKPYFSLAAYAVSTALCLVSPWLAIAGYAMTTGAWLVLDNRLEAIVARSRKSPPC